MAQIDAGEMELIAGRRAHRDMLDAAAENAPCPDRGSRRDPDREPVQTTWSPSAPTPSRVGQALDHLLENATRSVAEDGAVTLTRRGQYVRGPHPRRGHRAGHSLSSAGPRLRPLRAARTRRTGRRTGAGQGLVELHGGWAEVESEPGKGAAFILHLPVDAQSDAAAPELQLG
jgi:hypothetical protein